MREISKPGIRFVRYDLWDNFLYFLISCQFSFAKSSDVKKHAGPVYCFLEDYPYFQINGLLVSPTRLLPYFQRMLHIQCATWCLLCSGLVMLVFRFCEITFRFMYLITICSYTTTVNKFVD
jgi:hypothetical protein